MAMVIDLIVLLLQHHLITTISVVVFAVSVYYVKRASKQQPKKPLSPPVDKLAAESHCRRSDIICEEESSVYQATVYSESNMRTRADDFCYLMKRRRTVRQIDERTIPIELIQRLVETAGKQ